MSVLSEAIKWSEENYPLPRCEHGYVLRDHGMERHEPPCGCRLGVHNDWWKCSKCNVLNHPTHHCGRCNAPPPSSHFDTISEDT